MRCKFCNGSKRIMGGGMIYKDCVCTKQSEIQQGFNVQIDKRSKEYRDSINKIIDLYSCSRQEAADIFEEEYNKI